MSCTGRCDEADSEANFLGSEGDKEPPGRAGAFSILTALPTFLVSLDIWLLVSLFTQFVYLFVVLVTPPLTRQLPPGADGWAIFSVVERKLRI